MSGTCLCWSPKHFQVTNFKKISIHYWFKKTYFWINKHFNTTKENLTLLTREKLWHLNKKMVELKLKDKILECIWIERAAISSWKSVPVFWHLVMKGLNLTNVVPLEVPLEVPLDVLPLLFTFLFCDQNLNLISNCECSKLPPLPGYETNIRVDRTVSAVDV